MSRVVSDPRFLGLLHLATRVEPPVNLKGSSDPIDIYLRCAAVCGRSFARQGYRWDLVTNDVARVTARAAALGLGDLSITRWTFRWEVPEGVAFRSAHHKLELFEAFGTGAFGDHVGLVDLDTVLLRRFSERITTAPGLVGYDIGAIERDDFGETAIGEALSALAGVPVPARWWGGEFLLGRAADYAALARVIATLWPRYVASWRTAHHQGDEMVTSAALALLQHDGARVIDAGALGEVHRWWSARTLSPHPPLATATRTALLHLPADKDFLSAEAETRAFQPEAFLARYRRHARRKILIRRAVAALQRLRGERPRRYAPRLR